MDDGAVVVARTLPTEHPAQALARLSDDARWSIHLGPRIAIQPDGEPQDEGTPRLVLLAEGFLPLPCRRPERFSVAEVVRLGRAIGEVLARMHALGFVHGALCPEAVWVDADFGEARVAALDLCFTDAGPWQRQSQPERPHDLRYLSPELSTPGKPADRRADLYALGVLLYEALTGRVPFGRTDAVGIHHAHSAVEAEPVARSRPDTPAPLSRLVASLLAKDPGERHQSAAGVRLDLEAIARRLEDGDDGDVELAGRCILDVPIRPHTLFGREAELAALEVFFLAREQRTFGLVSGSSGLGKSSLVDRALHRLGPQWIVGSGKGDQLRHHEPFAALRSPLESVLQGIEDADPGLRSEFSRLAAEALEGTGGVLHSILRTLERHVPLSSVPAPQLSGHAEEARLRNAFHGLFAALGSLSRPVALLLDDLQWADPASIAILRSLASTASPPRVTLLCLLRDDEVDAGTELAATIAAMRSHPARGLDLEVRPLGAADVERLVAHALGAQPDEIRPLAEGILEHSQGNAMFAVEELQELWRNGSLHRSADGGAWAWSSAGLGAVAGSQKLSELMTSRVGRLAGESRNLLARAACFGGVFGKLALTTLVSASVVEVERLLAPAVRDGLLVRVDGGEDAGHWRFAHDQVQRAAYDGLTVSEREATHLRVGWMILGNDEDRAEHVPEAIGHLNAAANLIRDEGRGRWLAQRNLLAARNFASKAAFAEAYGCLQVAVGLIDERAWQEDHELARQVHLEAARAACLSGAAPSALALVETLRRNARSAADEATALEVAVEAYKVLDRFEEAIATGRQALEKLGVRLPTGARGAVNLLATHLRIVRLGPTALARLRPMTDPTASAAMRILAELGTISFLLMPALFLSVVEAQLRLSLDRGNAPESPYAYALYAIMLAGPLRQISRGHDTAKAALRVLESTDRSQAPRTLMATYVFVMPWKIALPDCLEVYLEGSRHALEVGDPEFANYHASAYAAFSIHAGPTLGEACANLDRMRRRILPLGQQRQFAADIYHQAMRNLQSAEGDPVRLAGPVYDEVRDGAAHADAVEMNGHLHLTRLMLAVLFDRPEDHETLVREFHACAKPFAGMYVRAAFFLYEAIALLRFRNDRAARTRAHTALLRMRRWARHCPSTFRHKVKLLQAEIARAGGDAGRAQDFYEEAAAAAEAAGFHQEAGLALEGACAVASARGRTALAQHLLSEARRVFASWGAEAKLRDLRIRHGAEPDARGPASGDEAPQAWGLAPASLDLVGVLQASQALSEGMELESTIRKIMHTVVAVSGAQRGALLVDDEQGPCVIAVAETHGEELDVRVFPDGPAPAEAATASWFAGVVVDEVVRSGQPLILSSPDADPRFRSDPHLQATKPRSLLCCPLQHGNERRAIVYLEHRLRRDAFGPRQLETVRLLSTQAAISLDNARLYARQLRLSAGAHRFVPEEFLRLLGKQDVDEVELNDHVEAEMTILVCDIRGFTSTTETMTPEASFAYINEFFALLGPAVRENRGFIIKYMGDGFMALFPQSPDDAVRTALAIPGLLSSMPQLEVGIGLHTGAVAVGAVGERSRIQGDVMSDVANVACRLESLTREHGVPNVLSVQTRDRLSAPLRARARPLGQVPVKGRIGAVDIFSLA